MGKRMSLSAFILSGLGILFMSLSWGQDTTKVLRPIPVFAEKDTILKLAVITSSVPHFSLSEDKLDELGTTDVGEALKYIPGIHIHDYGGIGGIKTVSYRSLGAGHTTVQIDGNQVPNLQSGAINLSNFELFGLKNISFSTGRAMDEGTSASGFINANSIALRSILADKPVKMRLGLYSNSTTINAYEKGVYFQQRLGKKFFIGAQGMVKFGNGAYNFIHPELPNGESLTRQNTELFSYRLRLVAGYQSDKTKLTLGAYHLNNEQELPGAAVLFNPSNDQKLWNKNGRLALYHLFQYGKWTLESHLNYQTNYTRYLDPHFLNLLGYIDVDFLQKNGNIGAMLSRSFRFPTERVLIGADLLYGNLEGSSFAGNPRRFQQNTVIGGTTLLGRFRIDANLTSQFIHDEVNNGTSEVTRFFRVSPFLALAYLPFEKASLRIRAFYKNTFRMPTFNDLYYNLIGNTNLKPEDAHIVNFGLTYGLEGKKWSLEFTGDLYYNRVKNKIVAIPTKDLFNWSIQNIGETAIRGADFGLLFVFKLKNLSCILNSNHSMNESIDVTNLNSVTYGHQIPYTPYYTTTNGFSVSWKGYKFSSNVLISGFRFSLNENIYANYLPGFTDLNLGLSKTLKIKKADLLIDLKVMNLLNKNYQVIRSFPMPGRYFQLRLKYTLNK